MALDPALALVRAWTYLGRREEALSLLQRMIAQPRPASTIRALKSRRRAVARQFLSQEPAKLHQTGIDLLQTGKPREALSVFQQALKNEPHHVDLLVRVAQCRYFLQDFETALEGFRTARSLLADDPEIEAWSGRTLLAIGDLPQARKDLETALRLDPSYDLAVVDLSETLLAQGNAMEALRVLEGHLERFPMDLGVLVRLAKLRSGNTPRVGAAVRDLHVARKLLQLALSRSKDWKIVPEEEYRFRPWDVENLRKEIEDQLAELDARALDPTPTAPSGLPGV